MNLQKKVEKFVQDNEQVKKALEIFKISEQQYQSALHSLYRTKIATSNSTNASATKEI